MHKFKLSLFIFLSVLVISSCEKDDICVEGDTPLLVIEFYDVNDTTALKNVTDIRVVGEGQNVTVNTLDDRSTTNTISIPLRTNLDTTSFLIISGSESDDNGNEIGNIDTVNFTYNRIEEFLSRGCGFIVNYDDLQANFTEDGDNWIQDIEIIQSLVKTSDSTHVKIFH